MHIPKYAYFTVLQGVRKVNENFVYVCVFWRARSCYRLSSASHTSYREVCTDHKIFWGLFCHATTKVQALKNLLLQRGLITL